MVRRFAVFIIWVALAVFATTFASSFIAKAQIEKRIKTRIEGKFFPKPFQNGFLVHDVKLDWKDQVRIVSGDVEVTYEFLSLFKGALDISLFGNNVRVELPDRMAQELGAKGDLFKEVQVSVSLGREGIEKVYRIHADSPTVKFHLEPSPKG